MVGRPLRMLVLLGASAGIPYAWFNQEFAPQVKAQISGWSTALKQTNWSFGSAKQLGPDNNDGVAGFASLARHPDESAPVLTGGISELEQVLEFNVSRRWIMQRWSRLSTVHAETELEGVRVALVTGTGLDDLAGSLTYYFDKDHQLRRITFYGVTGDERRLVQLLAGRFNMHPEPTLGAGLFTARWNGRPNSVLRISLAPVVRAQQPHERLEIMLELNRPGIGFGLSAQAQETLNLDGLTNRW